MPIAPSAYYDQRDRAPSRRQARDEVLKREIERVHADNYGVYGDLVVGKSARVIAARAITNTTRIRVSTTVTGGCHRKNKLMPANSNATPRPKNHRLEQRVIQRWRLHVPA